MESGFKKKRYEAVRECPKESHEDGERPRGEALCEWLRSLGLFSLKETGGDFITVFKIFIRGSRGAGTHPFSVVTCGEYLSCRHQEGP